MNKNVQRNTVYNNKDTANNPIPSNVEMHTETATYSDNKTL